MTDDEMLEMARQYGEKGMKEHALDVVYRHMDWLHRCGHFDRSDAILAKVTKDPNFIDTVLIGFAVITLRAGREEHLPSRPALVEKVKEVMFERHDEERAKRIVRFIN